MREDRARLLSEVSPRASYSPGGPVRTWAPSLGFGRMPGPRSSFSRDNRARAPEVIGADQPSHRYSVALEREVWCHLLWSLKHNEALSSV